MTVSRYHRVFYLFLLFFTVLCRLSFRHFIHLSPAPNQGPLQPNHVRHFSVAPLRLIEDRY